MDQKTHAWIAVRAIKLLENEGKVPGLVELLKPHTQKAAIGAWIPDKTDAKPGGAQTQNHVFKIGTYNGALTSRFITKKADLSGSLGADRLMAGFLDKYSNILDANWWGTPFKADPPPGKHLANRTMALTINNIDMLILGEQKIQDALPGDIQFISNIPDSYRCTSEQISIFFFMLSHFIADSLMPCHCDLRDLSDYDKGLHKELEKAWSKSIDDLFTESKLINTPLDCDQIFEKAVSSDIKFAISFKDQIPAFKGGESWDIWQEIVLLCRASFALASVIAPPDKYPYKPAEQIMAPFSTLFESDNYGKELLKEITQVIMHDAVLNVAMVWKNIWSRFK